MTSVAPALVSYADFLKLPDDDNGGHYELHDGEVVLVPPARPLNLGIQMRLVDLLGTRIANNPALMVVMEFPYKPTKNFQFWRADIAVIHRSMTQAIVGWEDYRTYAPLWIIEIESSSNTEVKVAKQRIASMSYGTEEFWFISPTKQTIMTTSADGRVKTYYPGDLIELLSLQAQVAVNAILLGEG